MKRGDKWHWTDEELGFLAEHPDWPPRRIAAELGRSAVAVGAKRREIREGWSPTVTPWSQDDTNFIINTPHMTAEQTAKHLGRTVSSIRGQRQILTETRGLSWGSGKQKSPFSIGARKLVARTCHSCGLLLQARWFQFMRVGSATGWQWQTRCTRCVPLHLKNPPDYSKKDPAPSRASKARLQALTLPHADRKGQPYLAADHAVMADPDRTIFEKAITLGRTYFAVNQACAVNGYHSIVGLGDPNRGTWKIIRGGEQDIGDQPGNPRLYEEAG